jgi:hypothetical protein
VCAQVRQLAAPRGSEGLGIRGARLTFICVCDAAAAAKRKAPVAGSSACGGVTLALAGPAIQSILIAVGSAVADPSLAQIPAWNYGTELPPSLRAAIRCGAPAVEREVELGKRIARWAPGTPL